MLPVGQPAPNFTAPAIMPDNDFYGEFNLDRYLAGSPGVLFFYPMNFSFICPTEVLALQKRKAQFEERGAKVILISPDSYVSHLYWQGIEPQHGGVGQIDFPMVSDFTRRVAEAYKVLPQDGIIPRATFIIGADGKLKHISVNDIDMGRNVDEILRLLDAIKVASSGKEVCPANWQPGKPTLTETIDGVRDYLATNMDHL